MYTAQQAGSFVPCPCLKVEIDDPSALTSEEWRIGPPCKWAFRPIEHLALKRIEAQTMAKGIADSGRIYAVSHHSFAVQRQVSHPHDV
jgi:hypothetical protein